MTLSKKHNVWRSHMSDAKNPPECSEVLKLLDFPLSAYEISAILKCSLRQTLERVNLCWWSIVPVTGDWVGWKYQRRTTLSATAKAKREIASYNDQGISPITGNPKGYYA